MIPSYRHSLRFFQGFARQGRPDLAAMNAVIDGRWRLAVHYARIGGLSAKDAWRVVWRLHRLDRGKKGGRT